MTNVIVPATTANLGVGFDCLGAALTMYNEFNFTSLDREEDLIITVIGDEADKVSRDKSNLVYQSFLKVYEKIERTPPSVKIDIKLGVPFARGLGSSATAIVGGLMGANELAGKPLSEVEIRDMAIAIEGHPDNVVPAYLGNCRLSIGEPGNWQICEIPWHSEVIPIVAIPNFELSTEEARKVLPTSISRSDAIFNISRMGLLLRGLATNNGKWLATALEDKLHQPYRKQLIIGYDEVKNAAIAAGAWGMVISGAGATLLALTNQENQANVVAAMELAWQKKGVKTLVKALTLDTQGARLVEKK
ncbi:MAG: homoserine kinase [Xenococcaceae cyanobacterium MO_188.B19]|nr:homoserine kinase [Xenococcaceae cyanobacterium MO_188.B19]